MMRKLWKVLFYLLNIISYPVFMWIADRIFISSPPAMVHPNFYYPFSLVLIFMGISTASYLLAHYFWKVNYRTMLLRNLGMLLLIILYSFLLHAFL